MRFAGNRYRQLRLPAAHRTWAAALVLAASTPAIATIEVNVTRVGFPTMNRGDVIRSGAWVPVIVDMALVDQPSFDGTVRVAQFDIDGDKCFDQVAVHLRAETGGSTRVFLYAHANPFRGGGRYNVEVLDAENEAVQVLSQGELTYQAQTGQVQPYNIRDDDVLILSLSTGAIGRVQDLVAADQPVQDLYARPLIVGHISPSDLPELWIGLEMVDYIVWDNARPERLTERQIAALLHWVRQGGTLLLAASRTAASFSQLDALYKALPVDIGALTSVNNLPELRRSLLAPEDGEKSPRRRRRGPVEEEAQWWDNPFVEPIPIARCTLRPGANPIGVSGSEDENRAIIAARTMDGGRIIFSGVALRDLFSAEGSAISFFRSVFNLRLRGSPEDAGSRPLPLFPHVAGAIAFSTSGSYYLLLGGVFSVGYVLLATFGTWNVLGTRGWRHHSWTAFAAVGVAASVLSVVAVNAVRGFGETLYQVSVVDADSGSPRGYAATFFGLKTGTDRVLDLWLPSDRIGTSSPESTNCFLRPISAETDDTVARTSFADPVDYRLVPASAVIENVRFRATLKRFEGRWVGSVGATLGGRISLRGRRFLSGSHLVNNLGVDLTDCYLLHTRIDPGRQLTSRAHGINAYSLGEFPAGARIDLTETCNPPKRDPDDLLDRGEPDERNVTLASAQQGWASGCRSVISNIGFAGSGGERVASGAERNALLLLSTLGEYDPNSDPGMMATFFGGARWSRDQARHLDISDRLRRDSMILLGFAEDPGPVRLFRRTGDRAYRVLEPEAGKSWTMYRIRIPVAVLGTPENLADEETEEGIR